MDCCYSVRFSSINGGSIALRVRIDHQNLVARAIAVVVFATPPFWLQIAITLAMFSCSFLLYEYKCKCQYKCTPTHTDCQDGKFRKFALDKYRHKRYNAHTPSSFALAFISPRFMFGFVRDLISFQRLGQWLWCLLLQSPIAPPLLTGSGLSILTSFFCSTLGLTSRGFFYVPCSRSFASVADGCLSLWLTNVPQGPILRGIILI